MSDRSRSFLIRISDQKMSSEKKFFGSFLTRKCHHKVENLVPDLLFLLFCIQDKIKADQLERRIIRPPSLLETAAYGLFFAGTFVGPQFTLHRFRQFVNGEYLDPVTKEMRNTSYVLSISEKKRESI